MRLGVHRDELARSLRDADGVWLYRPDDIDWDLEEVRAGLIVPTTISAEVDDLVASVIEQVREGDRLVVMSNGGFGGIHEKLLKALETVHA